MALLSVVVPCYNEEENVHYFYEELLKNQPFFEEKKMDVEVIYVDDGSKDGTVAEVKKLAKNDERVKMVSFSRNFGKEAAIFAGFQKAKGEPPIRSFFARMFYKLMNKISKADIVDGARDYRLMTRQVVDSILAMGEYNRFSKGIFGWVGYETKWIEYENIERVHGETKWSFWKLFVYSIEGITSFSTVPLAFASLMGVVFCMLAFALIIFTIVRKVVFGDPTSGWPSLVCIISLISGVQLFCLGIVGQYLAKTYMEVKNRPIYLVKEEI